MPVHHCCSSVSPCQSGFAVGEVECEERDPALFGVALLADKSAVHRGMDTPDGLAGCVDVGAVSPPDLRRCSFIAMMARAAVTQGVLHRDVISPKVCV